MSEFDKLEKWWKSIWLKIKILLGLEKEDECELNPQEFRSGFIWKPIAEHNPNVVVLMPANATGRTKTRAHLEQDGKVLEVANYTGIGNGNREHYRFSKTGSRYPKNIKFVCEVDKCTFKYHIANPAQRYDGNVTPTA